MNGTEAFPRMRRNPFLWVQPNNFSTANATDNCNDSGMPPALLVYIFFVLHGTLTTWHHLQGTSATGGRQHASLTSRTRGLPAGQTLPGGGRGGGRAAAGRCRHTPPAPWLLPAPELPRPGQRGECPGGAPSGLAASSARRAGSAAGTAPPRPAPHLASGSRRRAGLFGATPGGAERDGSRCCRRRRKSLHGPAPRAFMGCGPGPAVNQRCRGAPPARPSAAVT